MNPTLRSMSSSMECRICLSGEYPETLLAPCRCRGTSAYIHESCLRTYIRYYPDRLCRVCYEPMEHPWIDFQRNLICATIVLGWMILLSAISSASIAVKLLCLAGVGLLLIYHVRNHHLTYDITVLSVAAASVLSFTDPMYLPQTIILLSALIVLSTLCLYVPVEVMLLGMVFALAVTYSVLLALAVATRTDPAFTGLFLLALLTFWLAFVRPNYRNAI